MKNHWQHGIATMVAAAGILLATSINSHALFGFGKKTPLPIPTSAVATAAGSVQVQAGGAGDWVDAVAGQALNAGDKVKTGADGKAVIAFSDGSKVQLDANSNFTLAELTPSRFSMRLDVGTLNAWVAKLRGRRFEARTPTAVAAVRGTEFVIVVTHDGVTTTSLYTGSLDLTSSVGRTITIRPGYQVTVEAKGEVAAPKTIPPDVKRVPEPKVEIPAPKQASAQPPAQQPPAQQQPAQQPPADQTTTTQPPPPPPPSPQQNTTVVSPSSP